MAISVSTLGSASDKGATSPWTALTSLSLTADDRVIVTHAGDADASAVHLLHAEETAESYTALHNSTAFTIYGADSKQGQTFTTTSAHLIGGVKFQLSKFGSPSGDVVVELYAADGSHFPTGDLLATGSIAVSGVGILAEHTISFDSPYSLSDATEYALVVSLPDGDASNYLHGLWGAGTDEYADGTLIHYASSWAAYTRDAYFIIVIFSAQDITLVEDVVATNAGNVVTSIWSGVATFTAIAWYIIVTNTSTAKAITAYKALGLDSSAIDKTSSGTGSSTAPNSGATDTLSQADELIIGGVGVEDEVDDMSGTWTTGAGNVSGNEQQTGTNGAGDASNISIYSAAEIVSVTTAQTAEVTGTDNIDWAACIATYKGAVGLQTLTAAAIGAASSVQTSSIVGTGIAPLTGAIVDVASSVQVATIAGTGTAPLTGTIVSVTSSVVQASVENVAAEQELTAAAVAVTSSVQVATIAGSGDAPLTGASISVTSSVQVAVVWTSVTILTAASVSVTSSVQNASIAGDGIAPLTGTVVSAASSVQQAVVTTTQILTAAVISVTSSVQTATIAGSGDAPLIGAIVSVTSSVQTATIRTSVTILTAAIVGVTSSVSQSSIAGVGTAPLTAGIVAAVSSVQAASISGSGTSPLTATVVNVLASVVASGISGSGSAPLTEATIAVTATVYRATLTAVGAANLSGNSIAVVSSVAGSVVERLALVLLASSVGVASSVAASVVTLSWIWVTVCMHIDPDSLEASRISDDPLDINRITPSRTPICRQQRRYT